MYVYVCMCVYVHNEILSVPEREREGEKGGEDMNMYVYS